MSAIWNLLFAWVPFPLARVAILALFTIFLVFLALRIVKLVLDALPFL